MTRRELFAAYIAAVRTVGAAEPPAFDRIDTHNHVHRSAPVFLASMQQTGYRALSICDSHEIGDQPSALAETIAGTLAACRESKGRLAWATSFDARRFEEPGFADRVNAALRLGFDRGAVAVKIWKNVGMAIRGKSGDYLMPDNPALLPIYEAIGKAGKTLIAHLAEPDQAWLPLAPGASGYYATNPEWHVYGKPGIPSKDAILVARDRVLARFPRLRVVGCHLGSNEDDLERLSTRLDLFSNFAVDLAGRVRYLVRGDREKVRQFLLKYQDRILYGTDFTLGPGDEARAAKSWQGTHDRDWEFFAGASAPALGLPEPVLRKIFHDNATRWIPGVAG